jgi:methionyl-tRNA synthetase
MESYPQYISRFLPVCEPLPEVSIWLFAVLFAWSILWKGAALWRAARNNQSYWFVALILVNTVGTLEILYIYVFAKKRPETTGNSNK